MNRTNDGTNDSLAATEWFDKVIRIILVTVEKFDPITLERHVPRVTSWAFLTSVNISESDISLKR